VTGLKCALQGGSVAGACLQSQTLACLLACYANLLSQGLSVATNSIAVPIWTHVKIWQHVHCPPWKAHSLIANAVTHRGDRKPDLGCHPASINSATGSSHTANVSS